jgi:hypothetical protein
MKNRIPKEDYITVAFSSLMAIAFFFLLLWMALSANGCL